MNFVVKNMSESPAINHDLPWVNPIGGLGDTLMFSGVLKQIADKEPGRKFNMVYRTRYTDFFRGHPAIAHIGYPPEGSKIQETTYWSQPEYGDPQFRAYQLLARMFGMTLPVAEKLYLHGGIPVMDWWRNFMPLKPQCNVLIVPASDSPRKQMHPAIWHQVVDLLLQKDVFVAQAGRSRDVHIRNAYSLLGVTTARELIGMISLFDVVVTVDNVAMHAAYMLGKPAVVLWGPTDHRIYGYPGQTHLPSTVSCGVKLCIGPQQPGHYGTPCQQDGKHCLDQLKPETISRAIMRMLESMTTRG